jgi:hypothetical protein
MDERHADIIGKRATKLIRNAEMKMNVTCSYRGREYCQEVVSESSYEAINKARAAIANRNFDAAFNGDYFVSIV